MSDNLVDKFVKEISEHIPKFITDNMPKSEPYALNLDDAEILMNAMVNFAAINVALIAGSVVKRVDNANESTKQEFLGMLNAKCNSLFTKVFMENT